MKKMIALLLVLLALANGSALAEALPVFASLQDARDYVNEQTRACPEEIAFRLSDASEYTGSSFANQARSVGGQYNAQTRLDGDVVTIRYTYYPGMRIYSAVQTGDPSDLTSDERAAAQIAVQVAAEAAGQPNVFGRVQYIHDWLCENIDYEAMPENADTLPRVCGAVGALVDGRANCQGYTDAFRLIGLLSGLDVRKQEGWDDAGAPHDWNVVRLNGKWYIVDATEDDMQGQDAWCYAYLLAGRDANRFTWDAGAASADIAEYTDPDMGYYTRFGRVYSDVNELARAAYFARRDEKIRLFHGMVREAGLEWSDLSDAILKVARERGKKCSWHVHCFRRAPYTYYTVRWTEW